MKLPQIVIDTNKVSAIQTIDYLEARAKRSSREKLLDILEKVPDLEPEKYDRLD